MKRHYAPNTDLPAIWIVNNYANEPDGAGGTRHFSLAKQLKASGYSPYIIAASTLHNQDGQRLTANEDIRVSVIETVPFVWLRAPKFSGNGLRRLWNMIRFAGQLPRRKLLHHIPPPALVIGSTPDPFAALGAYFAATKHGARFIYEVRDFWPISLIELGKLKRWHPLAIVMYAIEAFLCRRASLILTVQCHAHQYLERYRVPREKWAYLPNGVDVSLFPEPPLKEPSERFTFMYFGAHGHGNSLENILLAMRSVEALDPTGRIHCRLVGNGPLKPALVAQAKHLGLTRVHFEPSVPKREIPALAAQADVLLFNVFDMPILRYGISANKLFDYLAAKRPIIFACNASDDPVAKAHAGLTVPANNPEALANAMLQLAATDTARLHEMSVGGRRYVEVSHNFETLGNQLAAALRPLLAARNDAR
jgi:glycosyltransferase involved in cell wall biosynthesis